MKIKEIGRMIHEIREGKEISQKELCYGICSIATLSRLETGERRPNILIFNALFQRIGKSVDHINIVLTLDEFEYFVKRRNIEISIATRDFKQAKKELVRFEKEVNKKSLSLQKQDIYRLYALFYISVLELDKKKIHYYKKAEAYIYKAILETIPDFDKLKISPQYSISSLWLCEAEIQLLLLYIYTREQLGIDETLLLESVIYYIRLKITDEKIQNKQLSKALYLKAYLYKKKLLWQKCCECCEMVVPLEIKNGTIFILFECLKMEIECFENGILLENSLLRKRQYKILKAVLEEYGENIEIKKMDIFGETISQEKSLIDEVIHFSRLRSEYSQEQLSEGICTPETLSRIETGKRNPTIKNFYALMKKSGIQIGYYNTTLIVKKFETLEKNNELMRQIILHKHKEAEKLLKEMEREVDIHKNQQYIGLLRTIFDYRLHRIKVEDALKRIEKLLELSIKKVNGTFQLPYLPTSVEISLLNQLAVYYRIMGKQEKAVEILMPLYEYFHQSKIEAPERSQKYFMVLSNLSSYLEELDELKKAIELIEESLTASIKYNTGLRIGSNLIAKAYIQEREGNNNCLENYKKGYYLSGLFGDFVNQTIVKEHVLEKWNINMEI